MMNDINEVNLWNKGLEIADNRINFELQTLNDLRLIRENMDITKVPTLYRGEAYLIRMIDILLKKIEEIENDE